MLPICFPHSPPRLPTLELTNHLSRTFPIPLFNDYQHTTEDHSGARSAKSWISKPAKQELSRMTMHSRAAESNKQNWQIVTVQHTQNHFRQQQRFHFPNVVLLAWPSLQRETISEQRWLNCSQTMTGLPHLSQETQSSYNVLFELRHRDIHIHVIETYTYTS